MTTEEAMSAKVEKRYYTEKTVRNSNLKLVESSSWEAALEIARETEQTVQRLCKAVLSDDTKTAKLLAKELQGDVKEVSGADPSFHRITGRKR
jgi:hypothetical protein